MNCCVDKLILWYRNNRHQMNTWVDFVSIFMTYFVPTGYQEGLEEEISRRVQKPQEKGRNFIIPMQTLICRLGTWNADQELNCIYKHLPSYRQYIRRRDVRKTWGGILFLPIRYEAITKR